MNSRLKNISSIGIIVLLLAGAFSCKKDEATPQQLLKQQQDAQLKQLRNLTAKDSINYLLAMSQLKYKKYTDSLARVDSLSIATGKATYLPYTYEVQVLDGSISSVSLNNSGGRSGSGANTPSKVKVQTFASPVTVTITQYGVKQTQTGTDGLFTFKNIGVGAINGSITCSGYAEFDWTIGASLPFQLFQQVAGGSGTIQNPILLQNLLAYFNNRSFSNAFPIFATSGPSTSTVTGRVFIETDLTNLTKEVVPTGTQVTATIDVESSAFQTQYIQSAAQLPTNDVTNLNNPALLNSVFPPRSFAIQYLGSATTNATGDYTITVPGSPAGSGGSGGQLGGVPIRFQYSDVVTNKTFFVAQNGDATTVTQRNIYGPLISGTGYTAIPNIASAPSVTFSAGGGAIATAVTSGNGSVTAINLANGGGGYIGTPRVIFQAPPAGGTIAKATATVANGVVTGLTLVSGGSGYISNPTIIITEGDGALVAAGGYAYGASTGAVASVKVNSPGGNYAIAPNIIFWYDLNTNSTLDVGEELTTANFPSGVTQVGFQTIGTNFPTATAVLSGGGAVGSVTMANGGGGLQKAPNVAISSGQGARADITVVSGVITSISNIVSGRYYTSTPTVNLSSIGGTITTTAVLTPTVTNGKVTAIAITNGGAGYTNGTFPGVPLDAVGSGASGSVIWAGLGISSVVVTNVGTRFSDNVYYSSVPSIVFPNPQYNGAGSSVATGTAVLGSDGSLIGVNMTNVGSGYDGVTTPTILVVSGSGAAATVTFKDKAVNAINITNGGSGYLVAPQVLIVDPTKVGTGATAVANLTNGVVTSINVTNPGTGYISVPNVVFLDPGKAFDQNANAVYNNPALANVIVAAGKVTSVNVFQGGSNYPAGTLLNIVSGKGSGFTATATVAAGQITGVNVVSGGSGYVGNNYVSTFSGSGNTPNSGTSVSTTGFLDLSPGNVSAAFLPVNTISTTSAYYPYITFSGVTRVVDIYYGTGRTQN